LYRSWGAKAVAELIEKEFAFEKQNQNDPFTNEEAAHIPLIELGKECESLDENDTLDKFISTVIKNDYADYCAFIYENTEMIAIGFESIKDGHVQQYEGGKRLEDSNNVSTYISRHSCRTCQDIHYNPCGARTMYSNDPYIVKYADRYIACLPIICHGVLAGLIYLEKANQDFDANVITLIKNFLPVIASKMTKIKDVNLHHILSEKAAQTTLSTREHDVIKLMAKGYSNQQISAELNIALGTVKNHIGSILVKLETDSRTKAVYIAQDKNLI
jgi:DNA-binding CsgD family transcriptional regulator